MRIANSEMRQYVQRKEPFENRNVSVSAYWLEPAGRQYVVYSYGEHFPMYVYNRATEQWFGNKDRYSVTTSKHQSQCMPRSRGDITWLSTEHMKRLVSCGYDELVKHRLGVAG